MSLRDLSMEKRELRDAMEKRELHSACAGAAEPPIDTPTAFPGKLLARCEATQSYHLLAFGKASLGFSETAA